MAAEASLSFLFPLDPWNDEQQGASKTFKPEYRAKVIAKRQQDTIDVYKNSFENKAVVGASKNFGVDQKTLKLLLKTLLNFKATRKTDPDFKAVVKIKSVKSKANTVNSKSSSLEKLLAKQTKKKYYPTEIWDKLLDLSEAFKELIAELEKYI